MAFIIDINNVQNENKEYFSCLYNRRRYILCSLLSLITDFLLKYGETIHTKAVVEERLTGKSSYPVLRYRFFYGPSVKCADAYHAVHIVLI